jgi:Ni,Fe-hydrogenase III component G
MITDTIAGERVSGHRPWPRVIVGADEWRHASEALKAGTWTLLSLWGDTHAVHMAVLDEAIADIAVLTFECPDGTFPSVGALHPPAIRPERAIHDLYGLTAVGALDERPWLDLGFWGIEAPLGAARTATASRAP